jgi:hypothetical protein
VAAQNMDADQQRMLMLAADPTRSAQSSIVALQAGVETGQATRTFVEQSAVTIIDSPDGRLVAEQISSGSKKWMVVAPGSGTNIATAVNNMMRRLPANEEWFSYRKVV